MSGRSIARSALTGFLVAALAAPAVAQEDVFRPDGRILLPPPPRQVHEAPMPHAKQSDFRVSVGHGLRVAVPTLAEAPMPREKATDHRQLFTFTTGLFGENGAATPMMSEPPPLPTRPPESLVPPVPPMIPPTLPVPQPPAVAPPCPTPGVYHSVEYVLPLGSQRAAPPCCAGTTGGCAYVTRTREAAMAAGALQAPIVRVIGCGTLQHGQPGPVPCVIRELAFLQTEKPVAPQFLSFSTSRDTAGLPPKPFVIHWEQFGTHPVPGTVVAVSPVTSVAPANALIGTWYRDAAVARIVAVFTPDEMKLSFDLHDGDKGKPLVVTVTAHYTLTKDELVYGAVTGADVESKAGLDKDDADLFAFAHALADRPFSFRVKQTSAGMMVSGMKFSMFGDREEKELYPFGGLYKHAKDGKVPAPAAVKTGRVGKCDSGYNPSDCPAAAPTNTYPYVGVGTAKHDGPDRGAVRDTVIRRQVIIVEPLPGQILAIGSGAAVSSSNVERIGIDFNAPVPTMGQPLPPGVAPPPLKNVTPAPAPPPPYVVPPAPVVMPPGNFGPPSPYLKVPPAPLPPPYVPGPMPQPMKPVGFGASDDPMKEMALEAFGEMLWQGGVTRPAGGMTLPSQRHLDRDPRFFPADPCFPERYNHAAGQATIQAFVNQPMNGAKPGIVGTWYREIGPMMCVIKIEADHLTITAHASAVEDGKEIKQGLVVTADYHLTRNGTTVVGLITGLDMTLEGAIPEGADLLEALGGDGLGQMQKAFVDHPFAFNVRVYGDALMISSVKAPGAGEETKSLAQAFAGRYKSAGDKPLPKPKPIKTDAKDSSWYGGMTLPSGRYLEHYPQYFPPDPAFPLPRELANQEDPEGSARRAGSLGGVVPKPPAREPNGVLGSFTLPAGGPVSPYLAIPGYQPRETPGVIPSVSPAGAATPAVPSMTEPTAPPVPPMSPPTVPKTSEAPKVTEMTVTWRGQIEYLPDPTRKGEKVAGIAGQVFFYNRVGLRCAPTNGTLTVDLIDETPRPDGQPTATPERWQFDKDALNKLIGSDESLSHALFLPWAGHKSDVTNVKLSVRFDPDNGDTLHAKPITLTFGTKEEAAPRMSEPVKPELPVPSMPQPEKPEVRIQIPPLGPLTLDFAVPIVKAPGDRQLFNFSKGLFGEEPQMPQPTPPAPSVPQMAEPVKPELPVPQMPQPTKPNAGAVPPELMQAPAKPAKMSKKEPRAKLTEAAVARVQWVIDQNEVLKRHRQEALRTPSLGGGFGFFF